MASPEMLSINRALTFTSFCSSGFNISSFCAYMGTDLFKNLNLQSLEFITPSNSNTFLCLKLGLHFHVSWIPEYKFRICGHALL